MASAGSPSPSSSPSSGGTRSDEAPPSDRSDSGEAAEDEDTLARLRRERERGTATPDLPDRESVAQAGSGSGSSEPPPPSVSDRESSERRPDPNAANEASSSSGGGGGAGLVTTSVPGPECPPAETEAQEKLEDAIRQQTELLADFDSIVEDLGEVFRNLEGSTFVKRLKAASREQVRISGVIVDLLDRSFGRAKNALEPGLERDLSTAAGLEWASSQRVTQIQGDLEAFVQRTDRATHIRVLDQMKDTAVTAELNDTARSVEWNLSGDSIARAEFWADTFDRWADELVGPG